MWFSKPENTKPVALIIFFVTFVGIVLYVYGSKNRSKRLETYRDIPFLDEQQGERLGDQKDTKDKQ
ncbi:cbb3-type cytochrome c oxidase subunit 3 [Thiobacillus sp.]|uniref:cbb3-type cytochrome oxidase subunit 3 n=1 Tax=Thiobacillus sp. TaxID=924 RepID=UPI0025CBEBC4|nr:cbb3-type cytochrome c oxidase subunit 3 [Thiobacillus sp.]